MLDELELGEVFLFMIDTLYEEMLMIDTIFTYFWTRKGQVYVCAFPLTGRKFFLAHLLANS